MLSNDVKRLQPGEGVWAAILTRKGTLISDLVVYHLSDALLLEMEPEGLSPAMESLSRYLVSEDVTLADVTGEEALFSVEGPSAAGLLSQILVEPSETRLAARGMHHFFSDGDGEGELRVSAAHHGPGPAFDVAVPSERAAELLVRLLDAGRALGLRPMGWRAQEIRRIEAGIPLLGVDMDGSHLPLEAGLDDAISFNKGCYIGQEYVVRLAHRGHLNRKLAGLSFSGGTIPNAGDEIRAASDDGTARAAGCVTSAAFSPSLGHPIAMGYVASAFLAPGTAVTVLSGDGTLQARVSDLPFIK
jgi:folate-binding protein YgfZ